MPRTLLAWLDAAPALPQPGLHEAGEARVCWDTTQLLVADPEGSTRFDDATPFVIQLSRSTREVAAGWLRSLIGARSQTRHVVHAQLRRGSARITLSAEAPASRLEGLATLPMRGGLTLPQAVFEAALATACALGGRLSDGASAGALEGAPVLVGADAATPEALEALRRARDAEAAQRADLAQALEEAQRERQALRAQVDDARTLTEARDALAQRLEAQRLELDEVRLALKAARRLSATCEHERDAARRQAAEAEAARDDALVQAERLRVLLDHRTAAPEGGASVKTLDEHNKRVAFGASDAQGVRGAGVACPQCKKAIGVAYEMILDEAPASRFTLGSETVRADAVLCPTCGYAGRRFLRDAPYKVIVTTMPSDRLRWIPLLRTLGQPLGLNLIQTRERLQRLPACIQVVDTLEEAEAMRDTLVAAGAGVRVVPG